MSGQAKINHVVVQKTVLEGQDPKYVQGFRDGFDAAMVEDARLKAEISKYQTENAFLKGSLEALMGSGQSSRTAEHRPSEADDVHASDGYGAPFVVSS